MRPEPTFSLEGKVIVQVGASGLLGRALAGALARAAATLVLVSRDSAKLGALAAGKVSVETADITDEKSVLALRDRVLADHGGVDGVVFNAVTRSMKGFDDELANWDASMAVNATGLFSLVRTFGDAMAQRGSGSIVNIASHMGMVGVHPPLYEGLSGLPSPDYFFHKGGMINLTRYLAAYYGPKGVRANVVSPGGIFNPAKPPADEFLKRYGQMTALGRMADVAEIGGAVVFLLSDASTYITGANLPVDGGYSAK
jgi:NAD(P)-dependent dehydrogenase (short-subunit alcohol dehydrogenase family)